MHTAHACMSDVGGHAVIALYHRYEDAVAASLDSRTVEVDPLNWFHEEALKHPKCIGWINQEDQGWRTLRPLFDE